MPRALKLVSSVVILVILCLLYGFLEEPRQLKTRNATINAVKELDSPIRIVLLSDIHIGGQHVSANRVEALVSYINMMKPDIVLMPGDFINGHISRNEHAPHFQAEVDAGLAAFKALKTPLGQFATLGNHDVWYDAEYVDTKLGEANITVLQNRAVNLPGNICLVGLADHDTQREDPAAFNDCAAGSAIIAMMHSPDSFPLVRSDTVLAVAGHTHGGQINIPLIGRRVTATSSGRKYAYGKVDLNGTVGYVTAGIGTSILSARFRSPPEIVLLELRPI